jgi:hypothetical protein
MSAFQKADIKPGMFDVRSSPNSGHSPSALPRPLCADFVAEVS